MRSSSPHKRRFIKRDKEGVASVVGTIMALLIFLTILTIFVNTWLPVTMKEHERAHMDGVMNEMGSMKGSIDNMVIYTSVSGYPSFAVYQTIDLGAEGIPAFASATASLLTLSPSSTSYSRSYLNFTTATAAKTFVGGGSIELYAPNRYYVQQWIAYENGAIIMKQDDGQIIRAEPGISFLYDSASGALNVNYYQVSILGYMATSSGTQTVGLTSEVVAVNQATYNPTTDVNTAFTFITKYGQAYYDFLNSSLSEIAGIDNSNGVYQVTSNGYSYQNLAADAPDKLFYSISCNYLSQYDCYSVVLTMHNADGVTSTITYSHAYVNIEITK